MYVYIYIYVYVRWEFNRECLPKTKDPGSTWMPLCLSTQDSTSHPPRSVMSRSAAQWPQMMLQDHGVSMNENEVWSHVEDSQYVYTYGIIGLNNNNSLTWKELFTWKELKQDQSGDDSPALPSFQWRHSATQSPTQSVSRGPSPPALKPGPVPVGHFRDHKNAAHFWWKHRFCGACSVYT